MANNEIDIYGFIDNVTVDGMTISPQTIIGDQLNAMGDVDEVVVNINSKWRWRCILWRSNIQTCLRRQDAHITVNIDGLAASIASVIAMAGEHGIMQSNAMLMVHNAWTGDSW
ncbi:ATP-dependent Clp protease proteolytic subunit [Staphylococcus pseudoxylosus]|uniref:ATP-dependent Clp protease proteolytic subunit n=1 Tax=Staphylococcus pseudoxylosus TaxID=2282419 RepID=UPI00398ADD0F